MSLFRFFKKNKKAMVRERRNFVAQMEDNASRFISDNYQRHSGLDYSVESLVIVDKILANDIGLYMQLDEEYREELVEKAGSYIFEVARQNFGGKYYWYDLLDQPIFVTGEPDFEMALLAYEKVKSRFENENEDCIHFFFDGYVQGIKKRKSDVIV